MRRINHLLALGLLLACVLIAGCGSNSSSSSGGASASTTAIYVSPTGLASNSGTIDSPTTLAAAITQVASGGVIYLRGGTYSLTDQITVARGNDGTATQMKSILAYESETPILDFSSQSYDSSDTSNNSRGLQVNGDYWYIKGLKVCGSADNGIYIAGSHNTVENCETYENRDTGLQIGRYSSSADSSEWPSYNLILYCYSHDNMDIDTKTPGEDADGFACKLTTGNGNVFRGCISAYNVDDGWDLYTKTATGAIGPVTLEYCIAYQNGHTSTGSSTTNSDGNGFKLGGDKIEVNHVVTNCIAFQNKKHGFTYNSNPDSIAITHCTSWSNGEYNYAFDKGKHIFTDNLSWSGTGSDHISGTDNGNVWWQSKKSVATGTLSTITADDFQSLTVSVSRDIDGSPVLGTFLKLATTSALINKGSDGYDVGARSNQSNDQF
jgi:hypothetical protein